MKARSLITGALVALGLVAVWGVLAQHRQLGLLQAEQKRVLAQLSSPPADSLEPAPAQTPAKTVSASDPELLRLRSEVTALSARKRALAEVAAENSRLKEQAAQRATNAPGSVAGMLLARNAQMVGYSSPEDALQSFLWAVQNLDFTNFVLALKPQLADDVFRNTPPDGAQAQMRAVRAQLGALRILDRQQMPDGTVDLSVEVIPGQTDHIRFRQTGGQWRIESL